MPEKTVVELEYRNIPPANESFVPLPRDSHSTSSKTVDKRATALAVQAPANPEMVFFNWAKGRDWADYGEEFHYDSTAGNGVNVYVLDSGANLNSVEFTHGENPAAKARWLFTAGGNTRSDSHHNNHGTCMLSKVVGDTLGIAKKATPIIVKVEDVQNSNHWLQALQAVLSDLAPATNPSVQSPVRAIISMSFQYTSLGTNVPVEAVEAWGKMALPVMRELEHRGAFFVTGTGNLGEKKIEGYPAKFANQGDGVMSMLVVGACEIDGTLRMKFNKQMPGSNLDDIQGLPHIYVPGYDGIQCASGNQIAPYRDGAGTSIAAASVAGLAAYFMGIPSIAQSIKNPNDLKKYILSQAWQRPKEGGKLCVWNGVKYEDMRPKICNNQRRDGNIKCQTNAKGLASANTSSKKAVGTTLATSIAPKTAISTTKGPQPKKTA